MDTKKILIVDDDVDIVYTIKEICLFSGHQVVTANNGKDGFKLFKSELPDLVIVDYHMPGWNGLTTVKNIRDMNQAVSVLVLTVDERQEIADAFIQAGATDFAIKPIKAPDLIARINVNLKISEIQHASIEAQKNVFIDKGISSVTLSLIEDFIRSQNGDVSIEEVASGVQLAYQTVHRYMHHLLDAGLVEVIPVYGTVGRPKNRYKIV